MTVFGAMSSGDVGSIAAADFNPKTTHLSDTKPNHYVPGSARLTQSRFGKVMIILCILKAIRRRISLSSSKPQPAYDEVLARLYRLSELNPATATKRQYYKSFSTANQSPRQTPLCSCGGEGISDLSSLPKITWVETSPRSPKNKERETWLPVGREQPPERIDTYQLQHRESVAYMKEVHKWPSRDSKKRLNSEEKIWKTFE
ncbi:hypothetical protein B0H14DRAFT_2578824 [Mycena olivaceomarginata]|nr:hypothetical protein B0H14DRAFT_2578824 [Mycena olivaceomarginata]